jgi:hypothetical protein
VAAMPSSRQLFDILAAPRRRSRPAEPRPTPGDRRRAPRRRRSSASTRPTWR